MPPVQTTQTTSPDSALSLPADPETGRVLWTRAAARRLAESGILELSHYELLNGALLFKVKNPPHILALVLVLQWLQQVFGTLSCQPEGPIRLFDDENALSEPEPDVAVLTRRMNSERPAAADVQLIVEVADTTLTRDLGFKANLYSRAQIPEYLVLDLSNRRLHVHHLPDGHGAWGQVLTLAEDQTFAPLSAPDQSIVITHLLPPVAEAEIT